MKTYVEESPERVTHSVDLMNRLQQGGFDPLYGRDGSVKYISVQDMRIFRGEDGYTRCAEAPPPTGRRDHPASGTDNS